MDMFKIDNIKAEKAKAILQYNLLRTIQTLFRVTELFLLTIILSWILSRLPYAIKTSNDYFHLLISIIFHPLSIFVIGNTIVLSLLFNTRHMPEDDQIYQQYFARNNCFNPNHDGDEVKDLVDETEEIVCVDKETIFEEIKNVGVSDPKIDEVGKGNETVLGLSKLSTSKSENLERVVNRSGKLRRSETQKLHVFDKLSNEEFQNTIELFIAKQIKFHKAEKLAIVLHSQT